jgi:hypothetical protein
MGCSITKQHEVQNVKANYEVRGNLIVEVEAETQRELFHELASACEVFGEKKCGLCGSADIAPIHRTVVQNRKVFEYAEWHCLGCQARLSLGCTMEGGKLFPHRKLGRAGKPDRERGMFGKHGGWTKFRGEVEAKDARSSTMPSPSQPTSATGNGIGNGNANNKK